VIPHEARLETTHISFSKGCYTGQEIVERVRSRGHVNRVRAGLEFSGAAIPDRGAKLTFDGKEVGHVTRAGFSPALGHGIGMGYLRREHAAAGSVLQCGDASATVIELPLHTT
jgi:aminomethyltransferase